MPDQDLYSHIHVVNVLLDNFKIAAGVTVVAVILLLVLLGISPGQHGDPREVTQLYVYPVKGLCGCSLQKAWIGKYGLLGDRVFCLQMAHRDVHDASKKRYETMFIGYHLQLALFHVVAIRFGGEDEDMTAANVIVTWKGRDTTLSPINYVHAEDVVRFPLKPSTENREKVEVSLHKSVGKAYDVGDDLADWFTARLGFEARLFFTGHGSRPVLGSLASNSESGLGKARLTKRLKSFLPFLAFPAERLAFNDIAHYLVVTEESNDDVTSLLENDCKMDVTKLRPNIVVKGASGPFAEDFWGELTFENGVVMPLTANCYRCQSITVDYNTGKAAKDDRGMVWKKLNVYRRVDKGAKYSPVFGRYGYCFGPSIGRTLSVGQKAKVTSYVNSERTTLDWPHLATFGVSKPNK